MKRSLIAAVLSLPLSPAAAETVALTGVRLIDGLGGRPIENATILVRDGEIVGAGKRLAIPSGIRALHYRGRSVVPGLISDHSHVGQVNGIETGAKNYARQTIADELAQYRRYGVTTVTALGNNGPLFDSLRADAHAGRIEGADLFGVDQGIGVPNGAPPQAMIKVDPDQLFRPANAEEAREAVRQMASTKTDLVKLWLDDFGGSLPAKMKPEVYQAVIDESHKLGLRVAAHIHDLADAEAIVDAGADILAHGVRDKPVTPALIEKLRSKGTWYVPTLALDEATFAWADQAPWTLTPFARAALSPELKQQIDDPAWRKKTLADPNTDAARRGLEMNLRNLKTLHDAGVKIGFGTDSGATPLRVPGIAEHRELALMVQAGLSPLEALTIATANAAALLARDDRGTLQPGKRADFVVLDGNPSADISAADQIVEVWTRGQPSAGPTR